ncbi:Serpentine Receptor, class H [Caenorhabditis elegans]|uniref:Serpentine Receptor, class H n=1 Tax=Caenorhabditis elegans TaxID=6239 RepID=O45966_CAEEL|nr:Serpentine Receptor, class H [Caenorhabditis elegans]CAA16415.2 Serpentine Receptor, class H [Caenorhabditis elegans]|eukprot:NP_507372.2 Serpentine Receptor, class H [Caenorhabditis elegans]
MTSALEKYYATNYTKCNLEYNFLASWKGVAYPSHAIQVISLPFQILAFYVIIFKTPVAMKNVRTPLLVNHFFCAFLDLTLCTLSTVYFFLPMYGTFFVGVLSWFGVPNTFQILLVWLMVLLTVGSYLYFFEGRSSILVQNKFRITRQKTRVIYYFLFLIPWMSSILYVVKFIPEDQDAAKQFALTLHPCPTREFFTFDVMIFLADSILIEGFIWIFPIFGIYSASFILFQVTTLIYYICIAPSITISKDTHHRQKVFLFSILLQCFIPLTLVLCPVFLVFSAHLAGLYYQTMVNLTVCSAGLHGLAESIAIVTVHRPYRKAVSQMATEFKRRRRAVQVLPFLANHMRHSVTMRQSF